MKIRAVRSLATSVFALVLAAPALAQSPHDPARLFPHEAAIETSGEGALHRLALTAEVLERARPDLSDVRIHDAQGREVPFLVDSGARPWPSDGGLPSFAVAPLSVERRIEEGESLAPTWREVLALAPPGETVEGARWIVSVESNRGAFVRTIVVTHVDGEARTELARGSIYRFGDPLRERVSIELPALPVATTPAPTLVVELSGEGGYLEPQIRFTATRAPVHPPTLALPVTELGRQSREGSTWIELSRPVGVAPDRLRVITPSAHFHRVVRVLDLAQGQAPREIGRGEVFRVRELAGAEELSIELAPARGESLRVEVIDGDSPPLADLSFEAIVRQPVLVFSAPGSNATLRFGGGRARAPRYDLARFAGTMVGEALASLGAREAILGAVRANPRFDDGPALRFAMRAGRAPELARFTHFAPVRVEDAPEGLTRLRLPPAVLAIAAVDLSDVRIVDAEGRQWPYLRAPHEERDLVAASAADPVVDDRRSTYVITPPVARARVDRLVLHTSAPYLSRPYVLCGIDDDGRRVELTRGSLSRAPDEVSPIEIALSSVRVSRLELEIEDGSDAPIELSRVELSIPSPSLFLAAPRGDYRLFVGDAEASAPEYEIARAADLVLAVRATDGEVGAPEANPAHVEPPWYEAADLSTWIVWAVLLFAVLALGLVTLRLARTAPSEPPGAAPEKAEPPASNDEPDDTDGDPPKAASGGGTTPLSF